MRCIDLRGFGGPEVLSPSEAPRPVPGAGEVLIEVHAAGVNRPDCLQRQGKYPPPAGASPLLGLEVAGTVAACGPGTARFRTGDAVCAPLKNDQSSCCPASLTFAAIQRIALRSASAKTPRPLTPRPLSPLTRSHAIRKGGCSPAALVLSHRSTLPAQNVHSTPANAPTPRDGYPFTAS